MDFFKIFAMLLPHEGPASSIFKNSTNQIEENNSDKYNAYNKTSPYQSNKGYSKKESKYSINTEKKKEK